MGAGALIAGSIGLGFANSMLQASNIRTQGKIDAANARLAARSARLKAKDAIERGTRSAHTLRLRKEDLTGRQKVAVAAQGIDLRSGTAAGAIIESRLFGELDAIETITNAKLEALGYKAEALSSESAARLARINSRSAARLTVLGGLFGGASQATSFLANRSLQNKQINSQKQFANEFGRRYMEHKISTDIFGNTGRN